MPTSAANAAIAPIWVNVLESESASGEEGHEFGECTRGAGASRCG